MGHNIGSRKRNHDLTKAHRDEAFVVLTKIKKPHRPMGTKYW